MTFSICCTDLLSSLPHSVFIWKVDLQQQATLFSCFQMSAVRGDWRDWVGRRCFPAESLCILLKYQSLSGGPLQQPSGLGVIRVPNQLRSYATLCLVFFLHKPITLEIAPSLIFTQITQIKCTICFLTGLWLI